MRKWINICEDNTQNLVERVYRACPRKKLSALTIQDLNEALEHDPDGVGQQVKEWLKDVAMFGGTVGGKTDEELIQDELASALRSTQSYFQHMIVAGRLTIYREVYIHDSGHLRQDDLGACWTPHDDTCTSYNGGEEDGTPHVIKAWIADENVDWGSTILLRLNDESEDEIRIFDSADVHVIDVMPRPSDYVKTTDW